MVYIEGTDGVGKTSTILKLAKLGIECIDRNKEIFSKNMLFEISMEDRVKIYEDYLINHNDIIIFLVNNNEQELMNRIYSRNKLGEFDLEAFKYNQLYLDTYNYMKENNVLHNKLFLIDCTHLDLEKQTSRVKKLLENINA